MEQFDDSSKATEAIKELAKAVSTQAKLANRAWYLTMAVALIVLFPPKGAGNPLGEVKLPLDFGSVNGYEFYPVVLALFSVLIVAFASAHAQVARANNLAHQALKRINSLALLNIHATDLFDMFTQASVNRVAPLAQIIRGKYQFMDNFKNCPRLLKWLTSIYYLVLKLIAFVVYWGLPGYAFWLAFLKAQEVQMLPLLSYPMLIIGSLALLVVAVTDIIYVFKTTKILFGSKVTNEYR